MDFYQFAGGYTYTPDVDIKGEDGKYGIVYLPDGEVLLPFEYDDIIINAHEVNHFVVVKNGLYGAVHLEGSRCNKNDLFTARSKLAIYDAKPELIFDLSCKYDHFKSYPWGDLLFYGSEETAYLSSITNTVIHFEEVNENNYSIWGRRDNTLYLVSNGDVLYSEPFKGFRFRSMGDGSHIDYETFDRLVDIKEKYILMTKEDYSDHKPHNKLSFNGKTVSFCYYSQPFALTSDSGLKYNINLLGIREKRGTNITLPFAHTLQYVGNNCFIASCENGKFGLFEIKYSDMPKIKCGSGNFCEFFSKFILDGYDFIAPLGKGYYMFIKEGSNVVLYNSNDGSIKDKF